MKPIERQIFYELDKIFDSKRGWIRVYDNLDFNPSIRAFQIFLGYKILGMSICILGAIVPVDSLKVGPNNKIFFTYKPFEKIINDITLDEENYILKYGEEYFLTGKTNIMDLIYQN